MKLRYTIAHAVATLLGTAALTAQISYLCKSAGLTIETSSMILASIGAGILPVLAEKFWHVSRRHALALAVPGMCLLGWVVPTVATKMGTAAELTQLEAQAHNARHEAAQTALGLARTALAVAQRDQAAECRTGAGTRCKGAEKTLDNARRDLKTAEEKATGALVPLPWLPAQHATLLPIGLELTIWACYWVGFGPLLCIERDLEKEPLSEEELQDLRELHEPDLEAEPEPVEPRPEPRRRPVTTRLAAEQDVVYLLATGETIPSLEWLRRRWCIDERNKGTVTQWVQSMEARGLCQRRRIGRQIMLTGVEPKVAA
jgi:hypothetical protein